MTRLVAAIGKRGDSWKPEPTPNLDCAVLPWSGAFWDAVTAVAWALRPDDVLVPIYEDDVLVVGEVNRTRPRGLRPEAARATVDRMNQRGLLRPDISPAWATSPLTKVPQVCKAMASSMSRGVVVFDRADDAVRALERAVLNGQEAVAWLEEVSGGLAIEAIYEEWIPGPQFEVSGVVADHGDVELWTPLHQRWSGSVILEYRAVEDTVLVEQLHEVAAAAVDDLGLSWTGFCVEIRSGRIIEVNGRLGEDGLGYDALLRGEHETRYHRMVDYLRRRL